MKNRGISAPVLDRAIIDDLFDFIGADSARPVIALFLDESRDLVARIEAAAVDEPAGRETIRRAAHSLKSGAGQLGAAALSQAAAALEQAAEAGDAGLPGGLIPALARCAAETGTAFAALLQDR